MNIYQRKLLETYAAGAYAHLANFHEDMILCSDVVLAGGMDAYISQTCGDTLLLFLFRELGDDGDTDLDEYIARLERAKADIHHVLGHIEDMQEEPK